MEKGNFIRITPFSQPAGLDDQLAAMDWTRIDDTRVMVIPQPLGAAPAPALPPIPAGLTWRTLDATSYAQAVGRLRGSPQSQIEAHAQRLAVSPVPYQGFALCLGNGARQAGANSEPYRGTAADAATVVACAQFVREGDLVGLYDVYTAPSHRQQGLAKMLCERLLALAASEGARTAYLLVEGDNHGARRIYSRMGFVDAYAYHYRVEPGGQA